ncbi:MAG: hypothetical protein ABIH28_02535 [archaeon]
MISTSLVIVSLIVIGVWLLIELKRMRHKLFAIFLIVLIIFAYMSFSVVIKNNSVDLKTIDGLTKAGKVYFAWLGSAFGNIKAITTSAIKMDWAGNQTIETTNSNKK